MNGRYEAAYRRSLSDPAGFWAAAAEAIDWERRWDCVLDDRRPPFYRWFSGARLNTCWNALDRHVANGRGGQLALIHDSPVTGTVARWTYRALCEEVARLAGAMAGLGIGKGDRVLIYMPMVPEAVMGMLACARLGAVHSVVFGGFAAPELATRIDDAKPKLILSASCGIEVQRIIPYKPLLDAAIALASIKPQACLVLQRDQAKAVLIAGRDRDWRETVAAARPADCVPVEATDPLYILYTSGTTGIPKGVVRDNGGHAVALCWSLPNIYGIQPGEVFFTASDVGWVVGHSYIVYAPLLHGCTTVLYEGKPVGTPDAGAFWRVAAEHGVVTLFTAPTAFRAIRREDPEGRLIRRYDLSRFRALFLAGERADPPTVAWAEQQLGVPVVDHWWQTETGWPIAANCLGIEKLPVRHGSATRAVPGWDVRVLDPEGRPVPPGEVGALAIKLPLPPGALTTLWQADERFRTSYLAEYPGFYQTADAGAYWRVIAQHGVKTLFTAPTGFRAVKREDPEGKLIGDYDLSGFRYLFLAGERLDPETYKWASEHLSVPVVDHWWQTETGWPIVADLMGMDPMPIKAGSPTVPVPGYDVRVLDATGQEVPAGTEGAIMIRTPLPPGTLSTLWRNDENYIQTYLSRVPGYYLTGDGGHFDEDGYLFVMGRVDDVINVAGHRLSTGEMEEIIAGHPDVAECAVIGVADELKGQVPRALVVLKGGVTRDHATISEEVVQRVRDQVGSVASLRRVDVVAALPKTRSGKILRKSMRAIADGRDEPVPSTIDDPAVLEALKPILRTGA